WEGASARGPRPAPSATEALCPLDNKHILFYSIIEKGEEHCGHLIEAHKECMRALGFKI
uniref:Cytochrome c oxidase copper chaperone n=1 Tax=Spermophilus dauricus TaxID=99837 RepID=A0A8C9PQW0_SPEDA